MPFVTEEIWCLLPGARGPAGRRTRSRRPTSRCSTTRPRRRSAAAIEADPRAARLARAGRAPAGGDPAQRALSRASEPHELVGRLARRRVRRRRRRRRSARRRPGRAARPGASVDAEADRARLERRRERAARARSSAPSASWPTSASSRGPRRSWSTASATSCGALPRPSARPSLADRRPEADAAASAREDPGSRPRHALRPGADARAAATALGLPAAPLRPDPHRRHQRQVVGDPADGRAAGGARRARAAPTSRPTSPLDASASRSAAAEIGEDEFAAAVERVARGGRDGLAMPDEGDAVTQFEALTAAAFGAFAAAGVDAAVIEAGLGGRLRRDQRAPAGRHGR